MSGKSSRQLRFERTRRRKPLSRRQRRLRNWGIAGAAAVALIAVIVMVNRAAGTSSGPAASPTPSSAMDMGQPNPADQGSAQYPYAVGDPGVGAAAPEFSLKSTSGDMFDLDSQLAKGPVLLYFQEGLTCQPCWDQIVALQKSMADFHALGIDTVVSITNDPYDQLKTKASDENLTIPVLADPSGSVCNEFGTLRYGMMMGMNPGHTFMLVGKDGKIKWRADYGGPPKYTMYLPPATLLQDLKSGLGANH